VCNSSATGPGARDPMSIVPAAEASLAAPSPLLAPLPADTLQEYRAWLQLCLTPGVGPTLARALLTEFGLPEEALEQSTSRLGKVVSSAVAAALRAPAEPTLALIEASLDWLQTTPQAHLLHWGDTDYPAALLQLSDPPPLLFARGRLQTLDAPALGIVGSRNPTRAGQEHAHDFAQSLASSGWCVVSGLAMGIDAAAHQGALLAQRRANPSTSASTIAVVGTGLDEVYPRQNQVLGQAMFAHGLVLSEHPPGTPALPAHFPRRNRLIAALGAGVLVVEAARQSGSLITARLAADLGREVFAIPGSIDSPMARGCHYLIKQGAKLVESAEDVLSELASLPVAQPLAASSPRAQVGSVLRPNLRSTHQNPGIAPGHQSLLEQLGWEPTAPDQLAESLSMSAPTIAEALTLLELDGLIERLPDGRVQRLPQ
jgi:DNA processing protein